ncbi:uncharacterized protein LOC124818348 isoform X1 [Hydra vulgaris]|uniref:uncharacterized protein LOC124818348 isoform X1 n=1 Tax=Hydra vulgaris TaxID=6087 RepID=UPI0032E9E545
MSTITNDIKKLINFKYKSRNDSITDQFNRVLMMKIMLIGAFLTGMSWYKDEIKCLAPKTPNDHIKLFSSQACWINGFYIYKELKTKSNFFGYYGVPIDMNHNGTTLSNETCVALGGLSKRCKPMTKLFYLQFQWFPFFLGILALSFYLPYLLFRYVNSDLLSLKNAIKPQQPKFDEVIRIYFNRNVNTLARQHSKIALNIVVKVGYILVNVFAFVFTNSLLHGEFQSFGLKWFAWIRLSNSKKYNYVGERLVIKPGESLLPTFGFCDVSEVFLDVKHAISNDYKLVCEISQHILYHYVLIALWVMLVLGMFVSIIGFLTLLLNYLMPWLSFSSDEIEAKKVYKNCSIRERDYLTFINKNNMPFYGTLIRKLVEIQKDGGSEISMGGKTYD